MKPLAESVSLIVDRVQPAMGGSSAAAHRFGQRRFRARFLCQKLPVAGFTVRWPQRWRVRAVFGSVCAEVSSESAAPTPTRSALRRPLQNREN